jgi:Ni,Fe-hydrogenase maturation factor
MLTTGREETTLYDGRAWLTHYWQLRKNTILRYAKYNIKRDRNILPIKKQIKEASMRNIYSALSEEVWNARKINRKKPIL